MKKLLVLLLVVIMVVSIVACTPAEEAPAEEEAPAADESAEEAEEAPAEEEAEEAPAAVEPVVLKLAHGLTEDMAVHKAFLAFAEAVNEETNGAVKIEIYPNAQLGAERDTVEGMQLGTVDMTYISTAVIANFVSDYYLFDAPFLFANTEDALAFCDSEFGQNLGDELLEQQGIHMLGFMDVGGRNIFSTKPVNSLEDLQGQKIRTMENDIHIAMFNMLGAQATPMAFAELYTALQQGTVDAGEQPLQGITGMAFDDVCKNIVITNHVYAVNVFAMGDLAYEKIPEQYRDTVMLEAWNCVLNERELVAAANQNATEELEANGCTISYLNHDELVALIAPIYEQFSDKLPLDLIKAAQELASNS